MLTNETNKLQCNRMTVTSAFEIKFWTEAPPTKGTFWKVLLLQHQISHKC